MISIPKGPSVLSTHLQQFFLDRGRASAFALPEDAPIVEYMRAEIDALVLVASHMDDPATSEMLRLWSTGFSQGFKQRVQTNIRDTVFNSFMPDRSAGWPDALETAQQVQDEDARAAQHVRIAGTLHLPRRGVK